MKPQEKARPPLTRSVVIVALGVLSTALLILAAPRRDAPQTNLDQPATETQEAADAGAPAQEAASPEETRVMPPKLGALKEKPEIIRSASSPLKDLKLTFKLDPRLTRSLYMGDRWVSPATFTRTGAGQECTLEAKVQGLDNHGRPVDVAAEWTPADPTMVTVSQAQGQAVAITVHRAGQTTLEVASSGLTKRLPLNALAYGETIVVEVYLQ